MPRQSLQFNVPVQVAVDRLEVNVDNTIISADPSVFPGATGLVVATVDGSIVTNRAELREELQAKLAQNPQALVQIQVCSAANLSRFAPTTTTADASQGDIAVDDAQASSTKDEFDLDSDNDEDASTSHLIEVKTQKVENKSTPLERGSAEQILFDATSRAEPGQCLLLLCDGFNPVVHVEAAAQRMQVNVMHVDPVARVKSRQRMEEYAATLKKSLERGVWLFIENATKSITLLETLAGCIDAAMKANTFHASTRVILMCEPHPHFPALLMQNSITIKLKPIPTSEDLIDAEGLSESRTKMTMLKVTSQDSSQSANGGSGNQPQVSTGQKRRVRIGTEVDVVRIESSAFLEMSASAIPPSNDLHENGSPDAANGGIERVARYRFGPSEKMISLCRVAKDRFAVGTSSGYVVVLDTNGLPMIQYRPHKACIWDVAFAGSYDFATASEDGTSSVFHYYLGQQELEASSVASFQSDVFAVCYARDFDAASPVLSGGLSATVCVLHSDRKSSSFIPATTSIQALCSIPSRGHVLVGGGNGTVTVVDPESCRTVESSNKHVRKVPAVSAFGSTLLTGSFDKTLRVWDYRQQMHCSHNLVMTDVLTACAVSEQHVAACSGSSLYLWDLRMLHQVLAVKNRAWNGLTRGLVLAEKTLVTASVDGAARFWKIS
jgi:hypothetical protein